MPHVPLGVSNKFRGKSEQGLYGDVIMEIDWSVGEIMKAIENNGLTENTIVIFTSDNGSWLTFGNHAGSAGGLREGKQTNWEGGQRVPFIVSWPAKVPQGKVCNKIMAAMDILPTLAKYTHGKLSNNKIDGLDVSALWEGDFSASPRNTILYYYGKNNLNAVREGQWKLVLPHHLKTYNYKTGYDGVRGEVRSYNIEKPGLYNMRRDPGEQFDISEQFPEKVEELMELVNETRAELGDLNVGIHRGNGSRMHGVLKDKNKK